MMMMTMMMTMMVMTMMIMTMMMMMTMTPAMSVPMMTIGVSVFAIGVGAPRDKMTDSKMANAAAVADAEYILVTTAMFWRVKYRRVDADGRVIKKLRSAGSIGVHPKNHGGVYPSGHRCKGLSVDVLDVGFLSGLSAVTVEEPPVDTVNSRGADYVSGSEYNTTACSKDELLENLFAVPYHDVRSLMLNHNHIMLVLRAFMTAAHWEIPCNVEQNLRICDENGNLSLSAVAAHDNGKELAAMVNEGIECEQLAWQMDVEEPSAASIISQALSTAQEKALRTSELFAVAVLKGEIIVQMGPTLSQKVIYKSVLERVRRELGCITADHRDFSDVFAFVCSVGVGFNSYIDELLDFGNAFVDPKVRQLRLSALAVVNRISYCFPLTKIAVLKRSYRKKPRNGFCPNPENMWGKFSHRRLEKLEELLHFFHAKCSRQLTALGRATRTKTLANIDVVASDAFYATPTAAYNMESNIKCTEQSLLKATQKFLTLLGITELAVAKDNSTIAQWIDFNKCSSASEESDDASNSNSSSNVQSSAANIIVFDESDEFTGTRLTSQESYSCTPTHPNATVVLPWREWFSFNTLGAVESDKATAVAVLQGLHEAFDVTNYPIDIVHKNKQVRVVATEIIEPGLVWLPPCVPKQTRVLDTTENPNAVRIDFVALRTAEAAANSPDGHVLRANSFYVVPLFKTPKAVNPKAAVAAAINDNLSADHSWVFDDNGSDTMHPFWGVRRLTHQQLEIERENARQQQEQPAYHTETFEWMPRFNCLLVLQDVSSVGVCAAMHVPFLTVCHQVQVGEELILQVEPRETTSVKRSWSDSDRQKQQIYRKKRKSQNIE